MTAADLFRLNGRVAIVTGASSGLGVGFAETLAGAGAAVVVTARRAGELSQLADRLPDALAVPADLRRDGDRRAVVEAALDRYQRIDVLVNNAGIAHAGPAEQESLDDFAGQYRETARQTGWRLVRVRSWQPPNGGDPYR